MDEFAMNFKQYIITLITLQFMFEATDQRYFVFNKSEQNSSLSNMKLVDTSLKLHEMILLISYVYVVIAT